MRRRLFALVAAVSLPVSFAFALAGTFYTTGQFTMIEFHDGGWGVSWGNGGFAIFRNYHDVVSAPIAVLALPFAVLPLAWGLALYRRERRRRRALAGQCVTCGYALTGNSSGVCPECGTAVVRSMPQSAMSK